jgi:hypothetical protein
MQPSQADKAYKTYIVTTYYLSHQVIYLTILKRAWSANFKMVWYVLLRPLRPELDGQDNQECSKKIVTNLFQMGVKN